MKGHKLSTMAGAAPWWARRATGRGRRAGRMAMAGACCAAARRGRAYATGGAAGAPVSAGRLAARLVGVPDGTADNFARPQGRGWGNGMQRNGPSGGRLVMGRGVGGGGCAQRGLVAACSWGGPGANTSSNGCELPKGLGKCKHLGVSAAVRCEPERQGRGPEASGQVSVQRGSGAVCRLRQTDALRQEGRGFAARPARQAGACEQ